MGELRNRRHEAFAKELARGQKPTEAYSTAGYRECRQNAHRLSSNDDVKQRVIELQTEREIDTKTRRDQETGKFLQGVSGNPVGRPRGSRNKLAEAFIADLHDEWEVSGAKALKRVASMDPIAFCKIVAQILPSKIDATLTVDTDFLRDVVEFSEAWRLARSYIGADDQVIELQPVSGNKDQPGTELPGGL